MNRKTRYQGAIVLDHKVLLIQHRVNNSGETYWLFPGGGIDEGETEEECVVREMKEETNLDVSVERLIISETGHPGEVYKWRKTYLCHPNSGTAKPGYEPEPEASSVYSISAVKWIDLRDEDSWDDQVIQNPITFDQLLKIRDALGYSTKNSLPSHDPNHILE